MQEVLAADAELVIDEAVEVGVVAEGDIAFENHAIKASRGRLQWRPRISA